MDIFVMSHAVFRHLYELSYALLLKEQLKGHTAEETFG